MTELTNATIVAFNDEQTLLEAAENGLADLHIERSITSVREFIEGDIDLKYTFVTFDSIENLTDIVLIKKEIDDVIEYYVVFVPFEPDDFDQLSKSEEWLFDGEDFVYEFVQEHEGEEIFFTKRFVGDLSSGDQFAFITEYNTEEAPNPFVFCLCVGDLIYFYQGCLVNQSEIKVL